MRSEMAQWSPVQYRNFAPCLYTGRLAQSNRHFCHQPFTFKECVWIRIQTISDSSTSVRCRVANSTAVRMAKTTISPVCHVSTHQDTTRHDKDTDKDTDKDRFRHDTTRHDTTRHDTTRQDTTRHDTTRHDTTRQDTTRQDKTKQDKTR
jgi:hypothetical protein